LVKSEKDLWWKLNGENGKVYMVMDLGRSDEDFLGENRREESCGSLFERDG
jgi:hypothetical protein